MSGYSDVIRIPSCPDTFCSTWLCASPGGVTLKAQTTADSPLEDAPELNELSDASCPSLLFPSLPISSPLSPSSLLLTSAASHSISAALSALCVLLLHLASLAPQRCTFFIVITLVIYHDRGLIIVKDSSHLTKQNIHISPPAVESWPLNCV